MVSIFLVHGRRPEALVSTLALFYNSGGIGVVAPFATKLGEDTFKYLLYVHTDFHEQKPVHLSAVAPNSFTTKALRLEVLESRTSRFLGTYPVEPRYKPNVRTR